MGKIRPFVGECPAMTDAPPTPADLTLRLFGAFAATLGGQPLPRLRSRKEQHLLCLLALHSPRPAERVWLAGLLWPDSTEEAALSNLRRSLHLLRAALGTEHGPRLHSPTPATLALHTDGADVDVCAFDAALRQKTPDALETALALHAAPLLEDCTEDWAITERATRQETLLTACETCGTQCAAAGEHARAARLLRRALSLDPLRETTVQGLMESLAAAGDSAGAMDTFRRFRRRLRRELDAAPAPQTRALLGTITDALSPVPALSARLPRPLTPLIGRRQEVRDTVAALDMSRLVTLTGTGGVGKTRLAIAVAEDISEECEVCFIPLAALTDAAPLAAAVARTLDLAGQCDTPDALVYHLRERHLLLVLDNCEHLVDGCAAFAAALLEGCARLRVLATSRQPLGLPGETVRPVPLLSVPSAPDDSRPATEYEAVQKYEAVQLFVARAQAARASFSPDPRTLPAVVRICRRLDGLPLAIELAAARVRVLSCEQIARKLDDRFALLAGGNRGALPRHQTLRAAVDWSYDLLTENERFLLARLSVFAGGWTTEAAETVCADGGLPVLDTLSGLVDKSLVQMEDGEDGAIRYVLLETLREYGREKLALSGAGDALCARHARWFLALAEDAEPHLRGPEQAAWLVRLDTEYANVLTALDWSISHDAEATLQAASSLMRFWILRGLVSKGRSVLDAVLAAGTSGSEDVRLRAVRESGTLANAQGDYAAAQALLKQALAGYRAREDYAGEAITLSRLCDVLMSTNDYAVVQTYLERALHLNRERGDRRSEAENLGALGYVARDMGDYAASVSYCESAIQVCEEQGDVLMATAYRGSLAFALLGSGNVSGAALLFQRTLRDYGHLGNRPGQAWALASLAQTEHRQGEITAALAHIEEALAINRDISNRGGEAWNLGEMGVMLRSQGNLHGARQAFEQAYRLCQEMGNRAVETQNAMRLGALALQEMQLPEAREWFCRSLILARDVQPPGFFFQALVSCAALYLAERRPQRGAVLLGAVDALRPSNNLSSEEQHAEGEQENFTIQEVAVRAQINAEAFAVAWAQGRAMTTEQAVEYALQEKTTADVLPPREVQSAGRAR